MKRLAILSTIVVGAMLLASCYFMSAKSTGTIRIDFGGGLAKAITGQTVNKARVYLYSYVSSSNYSLFTFPGGLNYKESDYPGSVTLDNIPVGQWQVLVSIGSDGPNGSFSTGSYGSSGVISVVAGSDTAASVSTAASPFTDSTDLLGTSLNGVRVQGTTLYASSSSMLYSGNPNVDLSTGTTGNPVMSSVANASQIASNGLQIQSLANGYTYPVGGAPTASLFVNTNLGIVPYSTSFDTGFSQYLTDTSNSRYTLLESGAMSNGSSWVAIFYQRDHGLGGAYVSSGTSAPGTSGLNSWVDVDLAGKIVGEPVYQFAINSSTNVAYFASKIGAFATDQNLVNASVNTNDDLSSYVTFFNASGNATIQALGVVSGSPGLVFIGTPSGAYYATAGASRTSPVSGSWTPINVTQGDSIIKISAGSGYVALRSAYNLYVFNTSTYNAKAYPFFAGLPGTMSSMAWYMNPTGGLSTLFVAGSGGLVSLASSALP